MSAGVIILLVLTALCASVMTAILLSIAGVTVHGDAVVGQGIAWLYVFTLAVLTWVSMAGLLHYAGSQKLLPDSTSTWAWLLWMFSAIAAGVSLSIVADGTDRSPAFIPIAIPFLVVLYVIGLSIPRLRPIAASVPMSAAVAGLIGVLCCLSLFALYYKLDRPRREAAAWKAEMEDPAKQAERRERSIQQLKTMTDETPLEQWMPLLQPENGVRAEALAKLRMSPRRQADIERVVLERTEYLELIPDLDVQLTFPLCDAMSKQIWNTGFAISLNAERGKPLSPDVGEPELTLVTWYKQHGCDCNSSLNYMVQKLQEGYKDSADRRALLDRLAQLMR